MAAFVAFRGLQGLGGGVIISTAFAIVGGAFPPRERAKHMGLLGAMFGIASIVGPTMGGIIADSLGWRWIFYMNLPLGAAAIVALIIGLSGHAEESRAARIDWAGIALFMLSVLPLLLGLSLGGKRHAWDSLPILGLLALAIAAGFALVFVEKRKDAAEAILPIAFFREREYAVAAAGSFLSNAVFYSGILLFPLYLQRVLRSTATGSGLSTTPLVLAYTIASLVAGQMVSRSGKYRGLAIGSSILAAVALVPLCVLDPSWGRLPVIAAMLLLGLGLGATAPIFQVAAQDSADPRSIGAATSSIMFFRNLGSTVGSAVYGAVMTGSLSGMLARFEWGQTPTALKSALGDPQVLMNSAAVDRIAAAAPPQYHSFIEDLIGRLDRCLAAALSSAFWAALAFALAATGACLAFDRRAGQGEAAEATRE
jgi:MFS family permease